MGNLIIGDTMNLIFLCIKIFFARILDVTIGTVRTVIMVKGKVYIAAFLAFFEVLIWFFVAREALMTNIDSLMIPIAYSAGYATGTFIGTYISNNFIKGIVGVEIITKQNQLQLIDEIKKNGFAVSIIDLKGNKNGMLLCQINNKKQSKLLNIVKIIDPSAFIIVNETKYVHNGFIK